MAAGSDCLAEAAAATAARIAVGDQEILAFVPEPDRAGRLAAQARDVASRWPAGDRPPLFGVATGVKDVIRVDGLPTTGGARLPTAALVGRAEVTNRLADSAARAGVNIWITPAATGPAPAGLATTGDPVMSMPWSLAGLPAVSIPAGLVGGMPVGLQCVGLAGSDEKLLSWAAGIAAALDRRD